MKAVGIKVLKDKLSSYLKLVRQGEVVLVCDRDEIIAELRPPSAALQHSERPWFMDFLRRAAAAHEIELPEEAPVFPQSRADIAAVSAQPAFDVLELLHETREDRFGK